MGLFDRRRRPPAAPTPPSRPGDALEAAYRRQQQVLIEVRRGVAELAVSRKRLEAQAASLRAEIERLSRVAAETVADGREELARRALLRKAMLSEQLLNVGAQQGDIVAEEHQLLQAQTELERKIEQFRTQRETLQATYTAAEARLRAREALREVDGDFTEAGLAIRQAEASTRDMQARAAIADGTAGLGMIGWRNPLDLDEEPRNATASAVDDELQRLRERAAGGAQNGSGRPGHRPETGPVDPDRRGDLR